MSERETTFASIFGFEEVVNAHHVRAIFARNNTFTFVCPECGETTLVGNQYGDWDAKNAIDNIFVCNAGGNCDAIVKIKKMKIEGEA